MSAGIPEERLESRGYPEGRHEAKRPSVWGVFRPARPGPRARFRRATGVEDPRYGADFEGTPTDVRRIGVGSAMVLMFIPMFIMMLIAKFFIDRSRRATAFAEQKKQEAEQSNVNRQIVEARLQALQAQMIERQMAGKEPQKSFTSKCADKSAAQNVGPQLA